MTVVVTDFIKAPIDRVWDVVADFAELERWHPEVVRCETVGNGVGALRTVYFSDWWATERLERLDDLHHVIKYTVTACSRRQYMGVKASITLTSLSAASTRIDWVGGLDAYSEHAGNVNMALKAYYPTRIGHLKGALRSVG
ncbi:SRPBCC family protein [Paraburkholderia rhynchosiae]|uniref:Polyketide cyclase n=1 Tax=Paraburkholderia rhynchosiae TaxID=487049 RepID=A0A2N7VMU2_9BURK|nr:SRPBCC family protein [Paraburkholderia rhynchosiae]PMS18474.1 hypothetical protein C0Z16_35930 [Paraburkholderia rhynchosiae]CAB3743663.1 hypothetical protein LMG27174_07024 [Paraburkholderia rhynchosiae]